MEEPKRSRPYQTPSKNKNAPNLPPVCRIPIFKFLPTSELVRSVSKTRPLLGEYWSHDLKFVVEQRLPFGVYLDPDSTFVPFLKRMRFPEEGRMNVTFDLADCLGNKIVEIKHPELFQFSALCELTEHSYLPARFHATDQPLGALFGYELLAPLTNLRSLALLFVRDSPEGSTELPLHVPSISHEIQQVLSQVESLKLLGRPCDPPSINTHLLRVLRNLERLDVGLEEFCAVMPVMVPFKRLFEPLTLPQDAEGTLTRLDSLNISVDDISNYSALVHYSARALALRQILHFLETRCVQLSELSLPLNGEVSIYMPVFRAMPNLVKLALNVQSVESNGLIDCEGPSTTIKELSIVGRYNVPNQQVILLGVLAKLPCVHMLSINAHNISDTLQLAADVLSRRLFPSLDSLRCVPEDAAFSVSLGELRPLLESANLPFHVQILPLKSFAFVAMDPGFLGALYGIMKTNSAQFLLMKGPLHPLALVRLEEVLSEDRKIKKMAKVLARTDKDFPEQQRAVVGLPALIFPPDFTDVKICGVKTAGPKNGEEFTIRICHQHTRVTSYII